MRILYEIIKKETLVLIRDKIHLIGLFLMPACFVIILSVALNDAFNEKRGIAIRAGFLDCDGGDLVDELLQEIKVSQNIDFQVFKEKNLSEVLKIARDKKFSFVLSIPKDFTTNLAYYMENMEKAEVGNLKFPVIQIYYDALLNVSIRQAIYLNIKNKIQSNITNLIYEFYNDYNKEEDYFVEDSFNGKKQLAIDIEQFPLSELNKNAIPSASQQNVPAWSIFAMFFIIIPLASNLCSERQELTFLRLKTMPVSFFVILIGKIIPYIVINLLQLFMMILLGLYIVPILGGEKLIIGNSYSSIFTLGLFSSIFATSFGLFISSFCRTYNQVAAFAPPVIVILASIGGIIVPKIIMPVFMQKIASLSPFDWMLNGFFDLYLVNGNIITIMPILIKLFLFSVLLFYFSFIKLKNDL